MVHTLKERGDNVGADTWVRIIVAIETMRLGPSDPPRPSSRLISALAVHPGRPERRVCAGLQPFGCPSVNGSKRPEAAIRALVGNLSPRSNSGRSLHDGEGALHARKVSLRRRGISLLDLFDWPHQLNETSARSQRQLVKSDNCRVPPPVLWPAQRRARLTSNSTRRATSSKISSANLKQFCAIATCYDETATKLPGLHPSRSRCHLTQLTTRPIFALPAGVG